MNFELTDGTGGFFNIKNEYASCQSKGRKIRKDGYFFLSLIVRNSRCNKVIKLI